MPADWASGKHRVSTATEIAPMRIVSIVIAAALAFTAWQLAEAERQGYALVTGMCRVEAAEPRSLDCLRTAQPRTSPL